MNTKPALCVIAAGIFWGLISVFTTNLNSLGFTAIDICTYRPSISAAILLIWLAIQNPASLKIKLKDIGYFIGTGMISLCVFNWCYFHTIEHSQASIAVGLLYTSPVFVTLLSALLFHEQLTVRKLAAVAITVEGCFLISGFIGSTYSVAPLILLTGIASGFFYGLYSIFGNYALKKYSPITITFYTFVFASIGAMGINDVHASLEIIQAKPEALAWCMGISVMSTIIPYFLYTYGLEQLETSKVAVLVTVEPLVGCLVGILLFSEPCNIEKIIGMGCILSSTVILSRN